MASLLEPREIESLRGKLTQIPESTVWPRLAEEDWLGALGVFPLVFLSLFPVVVPFIFVSNVRLALRISNGVALVLLFLAGYSFGRFAHSNPWRAGFAMVILGVAGGRRRHPPWRMRKRAKAQPRDSATVLILSCSCSLLPFVWSPFVYGTIIQLRPPLSLPNTVSFGRGGA